jgi:uncharacterized protein YbaR (Trm112 family)
MSETHPHASGNANEHANAHANAHAHDHHASALSPELLSVLVCPKDHGELSFDAQKQLLTCKQCHSLYKVEKNIPNMLG